MRDLTNLKVTLMTFIVTRSPSLILSASIFPPLFSFSPSFIFLSLLFAPSLLTTTNFGNNTVTVGLTNKDLGGNMILESEELWVQILIAYLLTAWLWSAAALSMDAWAQTEAQQEECHLLHGAALSSNMNTSMMDAMELLTPNIDVLLCVFTSWHMCMQMHVNMYVHACEEQRSTSPRWTSSSIFLHFVYFFVETSSPQLARLAGPWDLPPLLSSSPPVTSTGVPDSQHSTFLWTCKPRSLCLHSQLARPPLSNLSSPTLSFSWVNISF